MKGGALILCTCPRPQISPHVLGEPQRICATSGSTPQSGSTPVSLLTLGSCMVLPSRHSATLFSVIWENSNTPRKILTFACLVIQAPTCISMGYPHPLFFWFNPNLRVYPLRVTAPESWVCVSISSVFFRAEQRVSLSHVRPSALRTLLPP